MYVRHDIVPSTTFLGFGNIEVDVIQISLHFIQLFIGDVKTQLLEEQITGIRAVSLDDRPVDIVRAKTRVDAKSRICSPR
jgi:hypothetical protein